MKMLTLSRAVPRLAKGKPQPAAVPRDNKDVMLAAMNDESFARLLDEHPNARRAMDRLLADVLVPDPAPQNEATANFDSDWDGLS
jgi:hypothetical protein